VNDHIFLNPLTRKLIIMFYFYILQSLEDNDLYCGYASDLSKRFEEHNKGNVISTKNRVPLRIVYYEAYNSEQDARERERQVKRRAKAFISLKRRIQNSILN